MGNQPDRPCQQIKQIYYIYSKSLIPKHSHHNHNHSPLQKITKDILKQLFQSFTRYPQYSWSQQITPLFQKYFIQNIGSLWSHDKQIFYRQMLENSGLIQMVDKSKIKNKKQKDRKYQSMFYNCQAIKLKDGNIGSEIIQHKIDALNSSIIDQPDNVPFIFGKKKHDKNNTHTFKSMMHRIQKQFQINQNQNMSKSQYYDEQILRSSVIIPETVFVQRLNQQSKSKLNNMLNFYKIFSESLQQIIKSLSLMACPLKHFQISLKRRVKLKKIKSSESTNSLLKDTRAAGIQRKKIQYNNTYLLQEIRDFTQSYTQFIWKYLDLYKIAQTQFSTFITVETAYGVVLKHIWTFASWIGERGFGFQERLIPRAVQKLKDQQSKLYESSKDKKKNKKPKKIQVDPQIVKLGCDLSLQTNPQKYLKKIVIIYRQLSKSCSNADQLILYYQALFQQLAKKNGYHRLFKMQLIIQKLLKMQDSCGQICYAWTTWNIMIQTIKKIISTDPKQRQIQEQFKAYLEKNQQGRLSSR